MQALFQLLYLLRRDAASGLVSDETLRAADRVQRMLRQGPRLAA